MSKANVKPLAKKRVLPCIPADPDVPANTFPLSILVWSSLCYWFSMFTA